MKAEVKQLVKRMPRFFLMDSAMHFNFLVFIIYVQKSTETASGSNPRESVSGLGISEWISHPVGAFSQQGQADTAT